MNAKNPIILPALLIGFTVIVNPSVFAQKVWYVNNSFIGDDGRDGSFPVIPVPDDGITGPKKTLSGNLSGALASSSAGDTIYIAYSDTDYGTATGEQPTITVTKNLTFRSTGGIPIIASIFQLNNTNASPNDTVIFDSGNFTLSGGLTLMSGVLNVRDLLIISDNSLITVDAGSITLAGAGVVAYGNGINVQYVPSTADYVSNGIELPATVKNLSFTRLENTINKTITLTTPVTICDSLVIRNNLTTSTNAPITLNGNLIIAKDADSNATTPVTIFSTPLTLAGSENTIITVPSSTPATGMPLGSLTIAKTDSANTVTLLGGNLDLSAGVITFTKGIFKTDTNILYLAAPTTGAVSGGAQSQGYVGASATSHVVGNVGKRLVNNGTIAGSTEYLNVFPVGTSTIYRPFALTFNPVSDIPTTPNAAIVVSHVNSNPDGLQGLPIIDGVETGVNIARYPSFYWSVYTVGNVGPSTEFDLSLTGGNFTDFDFARDVRIIRRHGAVGDVYNDWLLQGLNTNYDNEVNTGTGFTAINRESIAGLRTGGAIFTYGLKTKIVAAFLYNVVMHIGTTYELALEGKFTNYAGTLTYAASSTNTSVATVIIANDTLKVNMLIDGFAMITVKATDSNNDFATSSFKVTTQCGVECCIELPKEFSLNQNYPNPFNPTTNIKFGVPQSSSVKIIIYDILGREVATLVNANYAPGYYTVLFNANRLASGIYIYRMTLQSLIGKHKIFTSTKKLMLVK